MFGLTKRVVALLAASLAPVCMMTGCGAGNVTVDSPATVCPPVPTPTPTAKTSTPAASKPTPKPTAKPTAKPSGKPSAKPTAKPSASTDDTDPAASGDTMDAKAIADKVISQMADAPGYEATVLKEERPKAGGSYIYNNRIKIIGKKNGRIKLDVLAHYKPANVGVKIGWQYGAATATVRPAGALSFLTKDFPLTDKMIVSPNNFRPDAAELYAIAQRMKGASYSFELLGQTTVAGKAVHILKVVTSGTNSIDPDIQFEYLGFDPDTYEVKLWEFYGGPDTKTPIHRVTIESFKTRSDITDAELKV